jgi:type I protein arginine methyltransferase
LKRIKVLEGRLTEAKRDFEEYQRLTQEHLDVARFRDVVGDTLSDAPPTARDDDTHYFESYGANGEPFCLFAASKLTS